MTNDEKIQLINDLIKEDPETTIKDYLEVLKEIENIEAAMRRGILPDNIKFYQLKRA